ncbi:hypothetical protein PMAYCL1PPCAC_01455, partial [Pristionchus mayeri]
VIECVHLTLLYLTVKRTQRNSKESAQDTITEKRNETTSPTELSKQSDKIPNSTLQLPSIPTEDSCNVSHSQSRIEEENETSGNKSVQVSTVATFTMPPNLKPKGESEEISQDNSPGDNAISGEGFAEDEMKPKNEPMDFLSTLGDIKMEPKEEEIELEDNVNGDLMGLKDELIDKFELPASDISEREKTMGGVDSFNDEENSGEKAKHVAKKSDREMECPECECRTHSASGWVRHLSYKHATTAVQSGYSLRCDCGFETYSYHHSYKCEISNFTVICDEEKLIRRLTDDMVTKVVRGFQTGKDQTAEVNRKRRISSRKATHIKSMDYSDGEGEPSLKNPKSELVEKNCKNAEKNELECPECDYVTRSAKTWMSHLHNAHFTTALLAECSLRCDCGYEAYTPTHECDIMNFTVVKNMEKGRRLNEDNGDQDLSETVEMNRKRRQSRNDFESFNYDDLMDDLDGEIKPSLKKCKSESEEMNCKVTPKRRPSINRVSQTGSAKKRNESNQKNELKCPEPECDFRSRSVVNWLHHLRDSHNTTANQAGYLLRCDCGNESYSDYHSQKCKDYNVTLIVTGQSLTTAKCVLCEVYPKTPLGYIAHLKLHHNYTTLHKNGIYLKCFCGLKMFEWKDHSNHEENCDGRGFTLHRIDEE